jgi:DNA-binding transcriptional MerR regulator
MGTGLTVPPSPPVAGGGDGRGQRIGEVALKAGVTTRTLRYYQELGLLDPGHSPGGNRRYTDADAARLRRIIELRDVMGFDLERIREILDAEDRLAQLRAEAKRGTSDERRREILAEAIAINAHMQVQVRSKRAVLDGFLAELETKSAYYATVAVEMGLDRPAKTPVVTG